MKNSWEGERRPWVSAYPTRFEGGEIWLTQGRPRVPNGVIGVAEGA